MMIIVATTKLIAANAGAKTAFRRFTTGIKVIQLKYASTTPTLIAPLIIRHAIQMVQMAARRTRSVKMVKWVRGRTITVHLTTDTAARCHTEHNPNMYIPLLTSLSNHSGACSSGWSDHATPEQQATIIPWTMSEPASDATTFATESSSKRRLRNVTQMTGMFAANVARDVHCTAYQHDEQYVLLVRINENMKYESVNRMDARTSPGTLE